MKRTGLEVATSNDNATEDTLGEHSLGRNAVATISGANAVVVEWLNSADGYVLGDAISAIVSMFCNAGVMAGAYDTYRERVLQDLKANCPETAGKE
jgi:hypothetical protein